MVLLPCWKGDSSGWWRLDANHAGWRQRDIQTVLQCITVYYSADICTDLSAVLCTTACALRWFSDMNLITVNTTTKLVSIRMTNSFCLVLHRRLLRWHHKRCCWCHGKVPSPPLQRTIATFRTQLLLFSTLSLCWRWCHLVLLLHKSVVLKNPVWVDDLILKGKNLVSN